MASSSSDSGLPEVVDAVTDTTMIVACAHVLQYRQGSQLNFAIEWRLLLGGCARIQVRTAMPRRWPGRRALIS